MQTSTEGLSEQQLLAKVLELEAQVASLKKNNKGPKELTLRVTAEGLVVLRNLVPSETGVVTLSADQLSGIFGNATSITKFVKDNANLVSLASDNTLLEATKASARQTAIKDGNPVMRKPRSDKKEQASA